MQPSLLQGSPNSKGLCHFSLSRCKFRQIGASRQIHPESESYNWLYAINLNQERGTFTDNLVETTFFQLGQRYNVLTVNMAQHPDSGLLNDVVFYGSVTYGDGTIFGIWVFKDGDFTHKGVGGWINWAMKGWFDRDGDGGKHVVFKAAF